MSTASIGNRPGRRVATGTLFVCASLALTLLAVAFGVFSAAVVLNQPWDDGLRLIAGYFHAPLIVAGLFAALLSTWLYARLKIARNRGLSALLILTALTGAVLLWVLAMHAGLWLEWSNRRSALAYGSDWFYAEVYFDYLRGGRGSAVSIAAGAAILLPLLLPAMTFIAAFFRSKP